MLLDILGHSIKYFYYRVNSGRAKSMLIFLACIMYFVNLFQYSAPITFTTVFWATTAVDLKQYRAKLLNAMWCCIFSLHIFTVNFYYQIDFNRLELNNAIVESLRIKAMELNKDLLINWLTLQSWIANGFCFTKFRIRRDGEISEKEEVKVWLDSSNKNTTNKKKY